MPKYLDFKKIEKDEKTFTFSCNVRKFLGTQPPTKGVHIEFELPSSPKKDLIIKR